MINYTEALEEAERLKRMTGRAIIPRRQECGCDFWKFCERCAGSGFYIELIYDLCGHVVQEGEDLECEANNCAEKERTRYTEEAA